MEFKPLHTEITEKFNFEEITIIREEYFNYPNGKSNIYAKNVKGKIIWFAELPMIEDCYSNPMKIMGGYLRVSSWKGFDVQIDLENGKILENNFTK